MASPVPKALLTWKTVIHCFQVTIEWCYQGVIMQFWLMLILRSVCVSTLFVSWYWGSSLVQQIVSAGAMQMQHSTDCLLHSCMNSLNLLVPHPENIVILWQMTAGSTLIYDLLTLTEPRLSRATLATLSPDVPWSITLSFPGFCCCNSMSFARLNSDSHTGT